MPLAGMGAVRNISKYMLEDRSFSVQEIIIFQKNERIVDDRLNFFLPFQLPTCGLIIKDQSS